MKWSDMNRAQRSALLAMAVCDPAAKEALRVSRALDRDEAHHTRHDYKSLLATFTGNVKTLPGGRARGCDELNRKRAQSVLGDASVGRAALLYRS